MRRPAVLKVARRYAAMLEDHGATAQRADLYRHFDLPRDRTMLLDHARWQADMVCAVLDKIGGEATAIRLLGSLQFNLIAAGLITIGESWADNEEWLDGASTRAFQMAMRQLTDGGQAC